MQINIRLMTIADYKEVYEIWLATPGMGLNKIDDSMAGIQKYLLRNPNTCFVAECHENIVGVILAGHDGRRGYIHHTCVKEGLQKQGIGTKLLEQALTALKEEGINKVALVVFVQNNKGNAFWEKCGFSERTDLVYRNKALVQLERIDT